MDEADDRLAPISYLFADPGRGARGRQSSTSSVLDVGDDESQWNHAWADDVDDACARLTDADTERISLAALGRRALSRRELERTLRDRGVDDDAVARECDRLTRVGLLDDAALAQTLVAALQERKGFGRTAVAAELARRMLAPAAIEYALELIESGDEIARARELARKRAPQLASLDHDAAVRRLSGYLARRGYSASTIRAAVDHALAASTSPGARVRFR